MNNMVLHLLINGILGRSPERRSKPFPVLMHNRSHFHFYEMRNARIDHIPGKVSVHQKL